MKAIMVKMFSVMPRSSRTPRAPTKASGSESMMVKGCTIDSNCAASTM
jgi:hypothetical protein